MASVTLCVCVRVCPSITRKTTCAKIKFSMHRPCTRHALTLRSKGQRSRSQGYEVCCRRGHGCRVSSFRLWRNRLVVRVYRMYDMEWTNVVNRFRNQNDTLRAAFYAHRRVATPTNGLVHPRRIATPHQRRTAAGSVYSSAGSRKESDRTASRMVRSSYLSVVGSVRWGRTQIRRNWTCHIRPGFPALPASAVTQFRSLCGPGPHYHF